MKTVTTVFTLTVLVSNIFLYSHGFHKDTIIYCDAGNTIQTLEHITERVKKNKKKYVTSYDQQAHLYVEKRVRAAGFSRVPYHCVLSFNDDPIANVICSPTQHFYRLSDTRWVAAQNLMVGDRLLSKRNGSVRLTNVDFVQQPLPVYTMHVKDTYTFLVGSHGFVAHNVILPVAATIGFGIPFSTGCGSGIGAVFGPVGFIGGILLGAGCGFLVNACYKDRYVEYSVTLKTPDVSSYILRNEKENKSDVDEKIKEVLDSCDPLEEKQFADLWEKKGGTAQAVKDFKNFEPKGVQPIPTGERGVLADGRDINVRTKSLDGRTTLEIYDRATKRSIKIRYEE